MAFMQATELERSEEDIPDAVVDFFESHVLAGAADADIDPVVIPADAAIGADVAQFEAIWILKRR